MDLLQIWVPIEMNAIFFLFREPRHLLNCYKMSPRAQLLEGWLALTRS